MRSKWRRRLLIGFAVISGCVLGVLIYVDVRYFEPFWPGIRSIAVSVPDQESYLPQPQRATLQKLISDKDQDLQSTIDWRVARALLSTVPHPRVGLKWQFDWLLWDVEIRARFSREQRFGLYCHLMQFSGGQGILYGSQVLFDEKPNQLTSEQLAEIAVIQYWGWRHYELHPEKLAPDAQDLLRSKM